MCLLIVNKKWCVILIMWTLVECSSEVRGSKSQETILGHQTNTYQYDAIRDIKYTLATQTFYEPQHQSYRNKGDRLFLKETEKDIIFDRKNDRRIEFHHKHRHKNRSSDKIELLLSEKTSDFSDIIVDKINNVETNIFIKKNYFNNTELYEKSDVRVNTIKWKNISDSNLETSTPYMLDYINYGVTSKFDSIGMNLVINTEKNRPLMNQNSKQSKFPWPVKREAIVEGHVVLGGLMMVHSREDSVTCGPIMPQGGIQALEAMLYTLDILNNKLKLIPNVTIGAHILDDCDKDTYGLEMAVDFIKGSISNIDDAEYTCNRTVVRKVISGVVGAASSVTSIQVANLLRLFKIPQVSFFSTSPELSNKQRFEYFTRTIPSDLYQVKAMVDIVNSLGWSYISIIYEESNYGIKAFEELEVLLAKHNICIAIKEKLVKDSGVAEELSYDDIVLKLLTKPRARGVIVFGSDQEVAGVMRAVQRRNVSGAFSWIGSDGWSERALVSDGNEEAVEGTISVQPQANSVKGFKDYFLGLNVDNNQRNPWFIEFWEDHFHCRYPNSTRTPYNGKYPNECTGREKLSANDTDFEGQLQFVSDAVMAFGYAIRDMHMDLCPNEIGLCDEMRPTRGPELLRYLRKVKFEGLSGDQFHFDSNGDGPSRYNVLHFKQVAQGRFRWIKVGEYIEGELKLKLTDIQWKWMQPQPPASVCSMPCELGQAKQYVEGESCCWHCFNCSQYEISDPMSETSCLSCPLGTVPDARRSSCRNVPEVYMRPDSGWAIGAMTLSSTGIIITLFVCGVFVRHHDTPVVRAAGRELSYVLLVGILMCYVATFLLVLRPTDLVCGLQRFGAGFCFTVVYAALLTKTNRISRIFRASTRSAKRPSLISPRSQLVICAALISVQVIINVVWTIVSPARARHHHPTRDQNLLVCDGHVDTSYTIAFAYPVALVAVCTVYAVLTRKIPEAFNESKHIGFTMYTTCVIWLAFMPLYFGRGVGSHVLLRITTMSVAISLSAGVTLTCLFTPKLYIILIRPERNVRQSMMTARYSRGAINAGTVTTVRADQRHLLGPGPGPGESEPGTLPAVRHARMQIYHAKKTDHKITQTEPEEFNINNNTSLNGMKLSRENFEDNLLAKVDDRYAREKVADYSHTSGVLSKNANIEETLKDDEKQSSLEIFQGKGEFSIDDVKINNTHKGKEKTATGLKNISL